MRLTNTSLILASFLALAASARAESKWWQKSTVYQIYPRSFQDSNGDGVGDLNGITERLDYLADLGVDALWISPFYPSPMKDFGYDIADFSGVDPLFGTLADFDRLVAAAHGRGMRIIMDYVPNHSSDEHPWFKESRSSRTNPKRDWYIWRDGRGGNQPPSNWLSVFGGSAWTLDPVTGQYYYHQFLAEQPDVNWRNPDVQRAMLAAMKFWLDRGVDGFRVDAINHAFETEELRDEPLNPSYDDTKPEYDSLFHPYTTDQPGNHDVVRAMRKLVDRYAGDRVLITEAYLPYDRQALYYGTRSAPEAQLPFNFQLLELPQWTAEAVAKKVNEYEAALPAHGWPNYVLSNHDKPRLASRLPTGQVRIAAMVLLTLRGTPTLYYADELGAPNVVIPPERARDPVELKAPGKGFGRDPSRTPMLWDTTAYSGFSTVEPWLPVEPNYAALNVATQTSDPSSVLSLYKALLKLRRSNTVLNVGSYKQIAAPAGVFAFVRQDGAKKVLVALNFTAASASLDLGDLRGTVALTSVMDGRVGEQVSERLALRPNEGVVVEL
ncbi:MAG: alpha-amylase [Deltaproteobacteria bacterium]|nr:alpha-amylase [Deltaproteobacteria bacterium]